MPPKAQSVTKQVRTYLANVSPDARRVLRDIQAAIRAAAPEAVEAFSYGIPGFRFEKQPLLWYAAWKTHASIYPISAAMLRAHRISPRGYETSKGTIRFPLDAPPSAEFLERLVKARLAEMRKKP